MKNVIVGTAGHIDHGKSSLVEALTGTHPDRLEEEKRRGITIDLGFAFLALEDVNIGFVDVPGHERFVKNMLAGAGGVDLVLLVVAADESIKPQTREHFDICRLLAIPRGLVVITKADLVDSDTLDLVKLELRRLALAVPGKDDSLLFRLAIDRAFVMKGHGTVVTGTLLAGAVSPEDEVELFPGGRKVRVRAVHSGGKTVPRAAAGQRTALNLAGVELGDVRRGMVLAAPGFFDATRRLDVRFTLLPGARPLKHGSRVHFHQGAMECVAEVILLESGTQAPGASGYAQLRLDEPAFVLPGDRFIVRQISPVVTIGGGVVLDAHAVRLRRKDAQSLAQLRTLESADASAVLAALLEREAAARRRGGMVLRQMVARTGWTPAMAQRVARELAARGAARLLPGGEADLHVVLEPAFQACCRAIRDEVERFHAANPLLPGISREELRKRTAGRPGEEEMFRAALDELVKSGALETAGEAVKQAGRSIALSSEESKARALIERAFADAGLAVPALKDVLGGLPVEAGRAAKILQILLREQVLVRVTAELVFHRDALAALRARLAERKKTRGDRITVPEFKELAGISRKYAIPLLEYLDRCGVTRRDGDLRVIR
jgi:selenocysteine-specific elongation factor